jgi:hypothetical protein
MAFKSVEQFVVPQAIDELSTTAKMPLGSIVRAVDSTLGAGEFIYLKGVSGTARAGYIVRYDDGFQTALNTSALTDSLPLAISMAACTASYYGWYQISGLAVAAKASATTFADGAGLNSASGLAIAVSTNVQIQGAVVRTVTTSSGSGATTVAIAINRPHDIATAVAA